MLMITLGVVGLYAAFLQWFLGWGEILSRWRTVGSGTGTVALALLVATYFIRTHRMQDYFRHETHGRFLALFRVTQIHNLLNIMMPLRTGETSFPLLMRSEFGVPLARGASALFVLRLLDLHALLAAGGMGLVATAERPVVAGTLWALFLVLPLLLFPLRKGLARRAKRHLPAKLSRVIDEIDAGIPADLGAFGRAWFLTVFNWGIKVAVLAWVLALMGVWPLSASVGGALGGEISSVLPVHAPAGVGTYPAGIAAGAAALGASRTPDALETLASASVNTHLLIVISALVGTGLSLILPFLAGGRPRG
ncbi:lysylphosphatidylglycerol synthase domain-containing protein [Rhizobium sp. PP-CC-3G-465]|uniref:lysylphosphatidylglycerol synthase domain-containing protein n=1 Tax=Rhizobium sp. PP-CC-3G-465 TaxID=2135648 RepID=UPI001042DAD4|nr:lysylphosphatidylglycerol synthase-like protein [Rhizobium sp. PP-CC-3G-465]